VSNTPVPYQAIIDDLNTKLRAAGLKSDNRPGFRATNKATRRFISGRWSEGWRLPDFEYVHTVKIEDWKDNKKMVKYLRPQTLYLPANFESYRNQDAPEEKGTSDTRSQVAAILAKQKGRKK